jgi:uncharacterized protein (DUF362 family)
MKDNSFSRRSFIKSGATLAGVTALAPGSSLLTSKPAPKEPTGAMPWRYPNPGKIVIVENPNAVAGINNVNFAVVQDMFDQGIMQFTGITSSPAAALASLFPGLTTSSKIAIKPNLINSSTPTRKELVKAVITRLVQMLGSFPAANITLYERHSFSSNGYTTAYFGQSVNLVVDTSFPNLGYTIHCNGKDRPYSKSLHDADFLINMPVAKDHSCSSSFNFTFSFKNHLGTVNPGGSLGIHCDQAATLDIMADSVMTTKQRIIVLDALFAVYNGGPGGSPQAFPKKIMISQDPVTIDSQGRILLNALRVQNSLSPKSGSYIDTAAAAPYSIGIADPGQMQIVNVLLPVRLSAFTASLEGDRIALRWVTTEERNNAGFAVERGENGESEWTRAGFVPGKGSSQTTNEYSFDDPLTEELKKNRVLHYRLKQIDTDGKEEYSIVVTVMTSLEETGWMIEQNYPNPCREATDIPVYLPRSSRLRVEVLDAKGARVITLCDQPRESGLHYFHWDAAHATSGVYICRASAEDQSKEISMVVMK